MMKPVSKGTFNTGYGFFALAFIFGVVALSWYLFNSAISIKYLQIDSLLAAIIFSLLFLYIIFKAGQEFKAVDIYDNHLKIKWAWGLLQYKLLPSDIELFAESSKNKTDYIIIRTKKLDILFQPNLTNNELELKEQLKQWKVKRKDNIYFDDVSTIEKKFGGVFSMLFGVLLFIFTINSYLQSYSLVTENELIGINGTLQSKPSIKKRTFKSASQHISFYLNEFPQYRFKINGAGYEAINLSKLNDYQNGTNAIFKILKRDYDVKIENSVTPTYSEKHFGWETIDLYEAHLNSDSIITLDEYNFQAKALYDSNRKWGFIIFVSAILLFTWGWKTYR